VAVGETVTRNIRKSRGYRTERGFGKVFRAERIAGPGMRDLDRDWVSIESKSHNPLVKWIENALAESERHAGSARLAVFAVHWLNTKYEDNPVMLRAGDLAMLMDWCDLVLARLRDASEYLDVVAAFPWRGKQP